MKIRNHVHKSILIIDDSVDSQALLKMIFEAQGHEVYTALNGQEALSLLAEINELPSLILLDAHMPIMDGYQFRAAQKMNSRLRDIPVIVMTGDGALDIEERMGNPSGIMLKPLEMASIFECIATFIC